MSDAFTKYVDDWDKLCQQKEKLEKQLKPIKERELEMRKALADSIKAALGDKLKEGTNRYQMPDGRKLKLVHKIRREIETAEVANARAAFEQLNDLGDLASFDSLLRTKYELEKREFDKMTEAQHAAVSRMITSKPQSPELEIE